MSELNLSYGICHSALAPLRAEPSHRSEMVSQLLFGEKIAIKALDEENPKWLFVENAWDGYRGWVHGGHITLIERKQHQKPTKYITGIHMGKLIKDQTPHMVLPLGAELFSLKKNKLEWLSDDLKYKGKKIKCIKYTDTIERNLITEVAALYLGAPYLWGGKSILGIDCSGLSQMAYRLNHIMLPRDASQQVEWGQPVDFIEQALPGDLAFFDNEEGRIVHVGIMLDNSHIIHATESSGGVVIDSIDNGGIISQKLKKRTHTLRIIKRIIPQ